MGRLKLQKLYHKIIALGLYIVISLISSSYLFAASVDYLSPLVFNENEYFELNPDALIYGLDAKTHWIKYGMQDCRQASKKFSSREYLLVNPKLAKYYGENNCHAAIWDYLSHGYKSGRAIATTTDSILLFENKNFDNYYSMFIFMNKHSK